MDLGIAENGEEDVRVSLLGQVENVQRCDRSEGRGMDNWNFWGKTRQRFLALMSASSTSARWIC